MNTREFKKQHKPVLEKLAEKYDMSVYSKYKGIYYLSKRTNDYNLRVKYALTSSFGRVKFRAIVLLDWNWIIEAKGYLIEIIEKSGKYKKVNQNSYISGRDWFLRLNWNDSYTNIEEGESIEKFEKEIEKTIVKFSFPLIDQTKDLNAFKESFEGLGAMDTIYKYSGGQVGSLLILALLKDERRAKCAKLLHKRCSDHYSRVFDKCLTEENINYILENIVTRKQQKTIKLATSSVANNEEIEHSGDSIDQIFIVDKKIPDLDLRLSELLGVNKNDNSEEDLYLGELFDSSDGVSVGYYGDLSIVALAFDEDDAVSATNMNRLTKMEDALSEIFQKGKILSIHQTKSLAIYYSLINNKIKVQTGVFMLNHMTSINGKLTTTEQKLIEKAEDDFTKVSNLWHHHFKSITGLDTPYCQEFASIKMKEI